MAVMRIKAQRERRDMTQQDLANEMGVVQGAVANWENEITLPKSRDLPRLARVLSCSISDLFEETEETGAPYD